VNRHSGHIYDAGQNLASFDVVPSPWMFESLGFLALNGFWDGRVHA